MGADVNTALTGLVLVAISLLVAFMRKALKDIQASSENVSSCAVPKEVTDTGSHPTLASIIGTEVRESIQPMSDKLEKMDDRLGKVEQSVARIDERTK